MDWINKNQEKLDAFQESGGIEMALSLELIEQIRSIHIQPKRDGELRLFSLVRLHGADGWKLLNSSYRDEDLVVRASNRLLECHQRNAQDDHSLTEAWRAVIEENRSSLPSRGISLFVSKHLTVPHSTGVL